MSKCKNHRSKNNFSFLVSTTLRSAIDGLLTENELRNPARSLRARITKDAEGSKEEILYHLPVCYDRINGHDLLFLLL